jgi:hypothetical protein
MYALFVALVLLGLGVIWCQWAAAFQCLVVIGGAELAFAFYAFGIGNTAYSISASIRAIRVKADTVRRAVAITDAARKITISGIVLILAGVIAYLLPVGIIFQMFCSGLVLIALFMVIWGAKKLSENLPSIENKDIVWDEY